MGLVPRKTDFPGKGETDGEVDHERDDPDGPGSEFSGRPGDLGSDSSDDEKERDREDEVEKPAPERREERSGGKGTGNEDPRREPRGKKRGEKALFAAASEEPSQEGEDACHEEKREDARQRAQQMCAECGIGLVEQGRSQCRAHDERYAESGSRRGTENDALQELKRRRAGAAEETRAR
jgi:hypothetical protein